MKISKLKIKSIITDNAIYMGVNQERLVVNQTLNELANGEIQTRLDLSIIKDRVEAIYSHLNGK